MGIVDRILFWKQVHQRLKKLDSKLNKGARAKVLAQLAAKVPVPTPAERRKAEQDAAAAAAELKQMFAILTKAGWTDMKPGSRCFLANSMTTSSRKSWPKRYEVSIAPRRRRSDGYQNGARLRRADRRGADPPHPACSGTHRRPHASSRINCYLGYTDRAADVFTKAALDPKGEC